MNELHLALPFPPSTNTYWRHTVYKGKPRTLISERGRKYRSTVKRLCLIKRAGWQLSQRLRVNVQLDAPDKRTRDIDNYNKALLDALVHAGVMRDDSLIDELNIVRGPIGKPGQVLVTIGVMNDANNNKI